MNLYFKNSQGKERLIGSNVTDESDAMTIIRKFCDERNFKIYYYRTWIADNDTTVFDVGSYTEFFHLKNEETTNEQINNQAV